MNWVEGLQKAINYIEDNLTDDKALDIKLIAKEACCSEQYFRKIFSILTGFTVSEYIRNRCLSIAGEELLRNNAKVIDLALKYGYDSPESFTKAFTRFHGSTPNNIKHCGNKLNSFNPINIKISIEGGNLLEYKIISHAPIRLLGKTKKFHNTTSENNVSIPEFVKSCYSDNSFIELSKLSNEEFKESVLGYRDNIDCPEDDSELRFTLGVAYDGDTIQEGYNVVEIPSMQWVKFRCKGERPKALQEIWYRIYTEFMPFSSYELIDNITLEECNFFNNNDVSYIWIPIRQN